MIASHRTDGPGGVMPSGPNRTPVMAANDNRAQDTRRMPGVDGLVLSTEIDALGRRVITIRALYPEGELGYPLDSATDDQNAVALWRGLAREFGLALYLRDARGVMTPVTPRTEARTSPRRRGSPLSGRRPRFLARRKGPPAPWYPCLQARKDA